jgi:hypothetical protein
MTFDIINLEKAKHGRNVVPVIVGKAENSHGIMPECDTGVLRLAVRAGILFVPAPEIRQSSMRFHVAKRATVNILVPHQPTMVLGKVFLKGFVVI